MSFPNELFVDVEGTGLDSLPPPLAGASSAEGVLAASPGVLALRPSAELLRDEDLERELAPERADLPGHQLSTLERRLVQRQVPDKIFLGVIAPIAGLAIRGQPAFPIDDSTSRIRHVAKLDPKDFPAVAEYLNKAQGDRERELAAARE